MSYTRRRVLCLGLGCVALTQTACNALLMALYDPTPAPATSRTEPLDYGRLKVYYNDAAVAYLTPHFQLLFRKVDGHFKFRSLPPTLLAKAFAGIEHVRLGSVSDKGRRSYGNGQYIMLTFRAADLNAEEKQILEKMLLREQPAGGSAYTNPLINHGVVQEKQLVYKGFIELYSDFDNVFFDVSYPDGFFDDALQRTQMTGMVWDIPLDEARAKRQQAVFAKARTPLKIAADGTVFYQGKPMHDLAKRLTVVDVRTRGHM